MTHTLKIDIPTGRVLCFHCDIPLRLATRDEATFVQMTNGWDVNGPLVGPTGVVVVPVDFSLYKEA